MTVKKLKATERCNGQLIDSVLDDFKLQSTANAQYNKLMAVARCIQGYRIKPDEDVTRKNVAIWCKNSSNLVTSNKKFL